MGTRKKLDRLITSKTKQVRDRLDNAVELNIVFDTICFVSQSKSSYTEIYVEAVNHINWPHTYTTLAFAGSIENEFVDSYFDLLQECTRDRERPYIVDLDLILLSARTGKTYAEYTSKREYDVLQKNGKTAPKPEEKKTEEQTQPEGPLSIISKKGSQVKLVDSLQFQYTSDLRCYTLTGYFQGQEVEDIIINHFVLSSEKDKLLENIKAHRKQSLSKPFNMSIGRFASSYYEYLKLEDYEDSKSMATTEDFSYDVEAGMAHIKKTRDDSHDDWALCFI